MELQYASTNFANKNNGNRDRGEEILILKEDTVKFKIILDFLALDVVLETTNLYSRFVADRILRMNI